VGSAALICQEARDAPLLERRLQLFHDAQPSGINQCPAHPDIALVITRHQANAAPQQGRAAAEKQISVS